MSGQPISSQNLMIYYLKSGLASNGEKIHKKSQSWKLYNKHAKIIGKMRMMRIQGIQLTS
jgi:hypothetical protein